MCYPIDLGNIAVGFSIALVIILIISLFMGKDN